MCSNFCHVLRNELFAIFELKLLDRMRLGNFEQAQFALDFHYLYLSE